MKPTRRSGPGPACPTTPTAPPGPTGPEEALRGFAPDVRPPALGGADVGYVVDDTALGRMLFAVRDGGAVLLTRYVADDTEADRWLQRLADRVSPRVLREPAATDAVRRELAEYVAGHRRDFDVPVDTALMAPFQRTVLGRLPQVAGYGWTTTYGALAAATGAPRASRAVGAALGGNPVCVLVPCHRVLGASGALTGYAGGVDAKTRLLALEGALPARGALPSGG
ncbi:methylated-DNA--[protein]-cysteine S-methyltransferase [Thalassiella azotivora]